jgi:hypothetical protein
MRAASRPEPVGETPEIHLVDGGATPATTGSPPPSPAPPRRQRTPDPHRQVPACLQGSQVWPRRPTSSSPRWKRRSVPRGATLRTRHRAQQSENPQVDPHASTKRDTVTKQRKLRGQPFSICTAPLTGGLPGTGTTPTSPPATSTADRWRSSHDDTYHPGVPARQQRGPPQRGIDTNVVVAPFTRFDESVVRSRGADRSRRRAAAGRR